MQEIYKQFKIAFLALILLSLLTGIIYPLLITGLAQLIFPWQANGSLIKQGDKIIGSALIGQSFSDPKYFWGRPSATSPFAYNAENSSGSNLGPTNPALFTAVQGYIATLRQADPENQMLIPVDLVTTSGSGLDPEISPLAALYQIPRIAKARGVTEQELLALVKNGTKNRTLGILGEARVNVLQLNLAVDNLTTPKD